MCPEYVPVLCWYHNEGHKMNNNKKQISTLTHMLKIHTLRHSWYFFNYSNIAPKIITKFLLGNVQKSTILFSG